jgi:hypothetical protein
VPTDFCLLPSALYLLLTAHCSLPTSLCYLLSRRRGGEMADATDLKSVDRKVVWVRLPPSAPIISITYERLPLHSNRHNGVRSVDQPHFDSIIEEKSRCHTLAAASS